MAINFVDINEYPDDEVNSITTRYGGSTLDREGFRTLTVSGRGILSPSLKLTPKVGSNGSWLDEHRLPERIIKVEAMITTDSFNVSELSTTLNQTDSYILEFSDQPELFYKAVFSGISDYTDNRHRRIVVLTFVCLDPYLLSTSHYTTGWIDTFGSVPPVIPIEVVATVTQNTDRVVIQAYNTPPIVLVGDVIINDVYVIRWEDPIVTLNGQPASNRISLESDYENVTWGTVEVSSPQANLEILYQVKYL